MKSKIFLIVLLLSVTLGFGSCTIGSENAASPPSETPAPRQPLFSFLIFGDNGTVNPVFEKIVAAAGDDDISILISTGDSTEGKSLAQLQTVKTYFSTHLNKPYYVAIGDNDYVVNARGQRTEAAFVKTFGPTKRSFDWQNSHFTIFNSTDAKNSFSDDELTWLEEDLQQTSQAMKFLIMHIPINVPLSEPEGSADSLASKQNSRFEEIVTRYHVNQIYTGHFHGYLNYEIGDIPVAVTGGGGSPPQFGLDPDYHYLQVDVFPDTFENRYFSLKTNVAE